MIFAELQGKLGSRSQRAHERAEDLLTSTAFGLLQYTPGRSGVLRALEKAQVVSLAADGIAFGEATSPLPFAHAASVDLTFWPRFRGYGEPDLIVTLKDEAAVTIAEAIVEVKYMSPKSRRAPHDDELAAVNNEGDDGDGADEGDTDQQESAAPDPDQLASYWQLLQERNRPTEDQESASMPLQVIYLTAHAVAPEAELAESLRRCPDACISWLSWFDVWRVVSDIAESEGGLPMKDLSALLAHKGFRAFSGFAAKPVDLPSSGAFFRAGWFGAELERRAAALRCPETRLWSGEEK